MSKDDVRRRILQAAGQVFAAKGYDSATVREICQQAEVNVAAVNYYFGGKRQLYVEAVKCAHQADGEREQLREWPPGASPEAKLQQYIRDLLARMLSVRAPWQRQLMMREILNPSEACRELVQVYFRARFGQLLEILKEILPAGTPQPKVHQIGFSIIGQALYYHVSGEVVTLLVGERERAAHYQAAQLADHITQFSLAALGLTAPLSGECSRHWPPAARSPVQGQLATDPAAAALTGDGAGSNLRTGSLKR